MVPTMRVIIWIFHFPECLVAVLIYITPDDECPLEAGSDHVSVTGLWWPRHPCHECHAGPCRHVTGIPPSPAPAARHSNTHTLRHENRQIKWTRSMDSEDIHGHEDILAPYFWLTRMPRGRWLFSWFMLVLLIPAQAGCVTPAQFVISCSWYIGPEIPIPAPCPAIWPQICPQWLPVANGS